MAYTFPTSVQADYAADKAVYKTKVDDLVNRDLAYLQRGIGVEFAEGSETGASFVTQGTITLLPLPRWANDLYLWASVECKVAAGQTGEFQFTVGSFTSNAYSFTNTAYAETDWVSLQLKSITVLGDPDESLVSFQVRSTTGGAAYIRSLSRHGMIFSHEPAA